jgi:hypothetical protein
MAANRDTSGGIEQKRHPVHAYRVPFGINHETTKVEDTVKSALGVKPSCPDCAPT